MNGTVYIIVKVGWEFDDEGYYRAGEAQTGKPVAAYVDLDKATEVCDKMNQSAIEENRNDKYPMQSYDSKAEDDLIEKFFEVVPVDMSKVEVVP